MNNIKNENFSCENLRDIHMSYDPGVELSRERFDDIIAAAETERIRARRRRKMVHAALFCLLVCAVCSSLLFGLRTWENATAGKDDETKIVQQGNNLIIGNGVVGDGETVGVTVEEYASIEDIPEEIREKAHFINIGGLKVNDIRVQRWKDYWLLDVLYLTDKEETIVTNERIFLDEQQESLSLDCEYIGEYLGSKLYKQQGVKVSYYILFENTIFKVAFEETQKLKIETILFGLY